MRLNLAIPAVILFSAVFAFGGESPSGVSETLAGLQSTDLPTVQRSINNLRDAGPAGLESLLHLYDQHPDPRLLPAIDAVASQRDAIWSRLYWYTDLAQAQAVAKAQSKPILYLRLMGKLTDEYSCANSRFFRTVLYSNRQVSKLLREKFVLVWASERPVPVVTIDYGDGRTLKRTLTGNSIHYVLNSHGQVIDSLPGLFDPVTFMRVVSQAGSVVRGGDRAIVSYLQRADDAILRQWQQDAASFKPKLLTVEAQVLLAANQADAAGAMRGTISKAAVETPLLRAISPQFAAALDDSIDALDAKSWRKIAAIHVADAKLDDQSIAVIRGQNPTAYADSTALDRTVKQFQQTIAEDSVRDNDQMRRQVLAWLRQAKSPITLDDLNHRVYAELFLTPRNDPWLGLVPEGTYTALADNGCCAAQP